MRSNIAFILILVLIPIIFFFYFYSINKKGANFFYIPGFTSNGTGNNSQNITNTTTPSGLLSVSGVNLIDGNNNNTVLQGAMIESSFAYINRWNKGEDPTQILNSNTFQAMKSWNMNAVRINISEWIYQLNPTQYLQKLDQVISQANQARLYVILDFHDDTQSGSPHGDGMLHSESISWWKTIAAHYLNNQMIMFDPINEPHYPDWQTWLNGNGGEIVGFQGVISAIRSTGAKQIIVVEPGSAGKVNNSEDGGWATYNDVLTDPNIIYSKHDYHNIISGSESFWDTQWGPILNHHPIYYGEWAVLPHPDHPSHCTNLTSDNADQITTRFLAYLKARNASWTYWDFEPYRLIENYTDFTPTSFQTGAPWICESPTAIHAGAGIDIRSYLTGGLTSPGTTTIPSPRVKKKKHI